MKKGQDVSKAQLVFSLSRQFILLTFVKCMQIHVHCNRDSINSVLNRIMKTSTFTHIFVYTMYMSGQV